MAKLVFDLDALKDIVKHTRACKEHSATFAMVRDPLCWKEGAVPDANGWVKPGQIDSAKVPAHLQLVKDHGVYLMSSGIPRLLDPADATGTRSLVVYAQGMGPDDSWHAWQSVGGDDFAEQIDLDFVEKALASGAKHLNVHLTADKLSLDFDRVIERPRPQYNSAELARIHALSWSTARPKWAEAGKKYEGVIYGYDTYIVMQKVGRGLVVHEKSLLSEIPQKGSRVQIAYGEYAHEIAKVEIAPKRRRTRDTTPTLEQ